MSGSAANFLTILFSFNRAMQLDAALRSYLLHCADSDANQVTVLYKATGDLHRSQYALLSEQYASKKIQFIAETQFKSDVVSLFFDLDNRTSAQALLKLAALLPSWLGKAARLPAAEDFPGYIFFFVDDAIFIRDFSLSRVHQALTQNPDALGFSLRLGANTIYCYTKDRYQQAPDFTQVQEDILKFDWTRGQLDFNYPLEISTSVYRRQDLFRLIPRLRFHNPNLLEGRLASRSREFAASKPYLLCCEQSVAFCNPINIVQGQSNNRSGKQAEYTPEQLAHMFSAGYRIDVSAFNGFLPDSCHAEADLAFIKP